MFNIDELRDTFYYRKDTNSIGYTCIFDYEIQMKNYINKFNKNLCNLSSDIYEAYTDNLHITLIGLNDNLFFYTKNIFDKLEKSISLTVVNYTLILEENGLVVLELALDEESEKTLIKFRQSLESYGIKYKHQNNIKKLHSVIGLFNYEKLNTLSLDSRNSLFKKTKECIDTTTLFKENITLKNKKVVRFENKELKNAQQVDINYFSSNKDKE